MRHQKPLSRKSASALSLAILSSFGATSLLAQTQNSTWTNSAGDSNWSNAANWSPTGVPSNGNNGFSDFNVTVGAPSPTNVNAGFTIDSLTVTAAGRINILSGDALTINGPTLTDNGSIVINPTGVADVTQLIFSAGTVTTIISGTGAITLNGAGNGNAARLDGAVIQAPGHTINGNGNINAALQNNGTINGNSTLGSLNINGSVTNNAFIEATSGGSLAIFGLVTGGNLETSSGGVILGEGGGTITNLNSTAAINIPAGNAFNATGAIADNGTIVVNPTGVADVTQLIATGATINGAGTITLNGNGNGNASRLDGSVTQGPNHQINGNGNINASVINNGTINGNSTLGSLNINGAVTNAGLIEATNSGTLSIFGLVTGGSLGTSSGGVILGVGGGTLDNTSNSGTIDIPAGNSFNATGTLADDGSIVINPTGVADVTQLIFSGGTVGGRGTITLNGAGNGNASRLDGALTQSAGHTIDGNGNLNATVINNGTINGDSILAPLNVNGNVTNTAILESTSNGVLLINGATVIGGTLTSSTGGAVEGANGGTILNVTNKGAFNIPGGNTFNVSGTLTDNGTITVNSNQAVAGTSLDFLGATVTGSGSIVLNDSIGTAAELTGSLNQRQGHAISGFGQIFAALTNFGTVVANVPNQTLALVNNLTTNNGIFSATNGGALALQGATVTGGFFTTSTGGAIQASGAASTVTAIINSGTLDVLGGSVLNLNGAITNNGTITVNSDQAVAGTQLVANGATLSGTGSIVLNDNIGTAAELTGTLTQQQSHTLSGFGQIFAALTNNGTVNGNAPGQILALVNDTVTNNSLLESTSGGTLALQSATVSGGTLNGVQVSGGGASTISGVTNLGPLNILGGSSLSINGSIVDNGSITVNSNGATAATSLSFNGGTLSGTGSIVLNDSVNTAAEITGTLTQAASHTISGFGQITAALTNYGTINANASPYSINIFANVTNNGVLEATNGGSVFLVSMTVTQGTGGLVTASGSSTVTNSSILVDDSTISGGQVSTSSGGTLAFVGSSDGVTGSITNNGAVEGVSSLATVGQITGAVLAVGSGATLRITGIAAASTVGSVSVNSGVLDLTNNRLVINYASPPVDPVTAVAALLASGHNGGNWNGDGINSSTAALNPSKFAVGYLDGDTPTDLTARTIGPNQMIVAYTLAGDAFLENSVGFDDLVVVAQHFGQTGWDWAGGNFNYDPSGSVGFADLVSVAQNFGFTSGVSEGLSSGGGLSPAWQSAPSTAAVPEPAALACLVATAGSLMARRKRR